MPEKKNKKNKKTEKKDTNVKVDVGGGLFLPSVFNFYANVNTWLVNWIFLKFICSTDVVSVVKFQMLMMKYQ